MAARLSDSDLAARVRESNRRRGEQYRQRLTQRGKTALTVWIPNDVRTALDRLAAQRHATIADTAGLILQAGLRAEVQAIDLEEVATDTEGKVKPVSADLFNPPSNPPSSVSVGIDPATQDNAADLAREKPTDGDWAVTEARILDLHQQGLSSRAIAAQVGCSQNKVLTTIRRAEKGG